MVTETVKTVVCIHNSQTVTLPEGDVSTCRICRQKILSGTTILHNGAVTFLPETVLERGYIGGFITEVHPPPMDTQPKIKEEIVSTETPLTSEEKSAIAHEAKQRGIPTVAREKGLKVKTVIAWVGRYCRKPKVHVDKKHARFLEKREEDKKAIMFDYKNMLLRDFYKKWHLNSKTWVSLKEAWSVPAKGEDQVANQAKPDGLNIIVHVYTLADGFPAFKECLTGESQMEWLRTYRDLNLYAPKDAAGVQTQIAGQVKELVHAR